MAKQGSPKLTRRKMFAASSMPLLAASNTAWSQADRASRNPAAGTGNADSRSSCRRCEVVLGTKYKSLVVFTPGPGRGSVPAPQSVAFEPMVAPTDALNLAQKGLYKELQSIAPGDTWQESFWIRPSGFR
jgi:galactose mutarotase-like enzyme